MAERVLPGGLFDLEALQERLYAVAEELHDIERQLRLVAHIAEIDSGVLEDQIRDIEKKLTEGWVPPARSAAEIVDELRLLEPQDEPQDVAALADQRRDGDRPPVVRRGTVRRVTRPWAGLALTDEELKSVYVGEGESITQNADQRRALTIHAPIPVIDSDPNVLGEHLREVTFVGEGYGCYDTFDVRPDAEDLGHEEAMKFIMGDADASEDWALDAERFEGRRFRYQGLIIDCFWYWDGDGTLAFRITHPLLGLLRVIENDDCKKSYCWDDVDLSGSSEEDDRG